MPLTKPLAQHTLRELLEALGEEQLTAAGQLLEAVRQTFGLPLTFTSAPAADVTDRIGRRLGHVRTEEQAEVRAGRAFSVSLLAGPVAAQQSVAQLFNPAASGKTLLVSSIVASVPTAGEVDLVRHNAALGGLANPQGSNRLVGGGAHVAEGRLHAAAGPPGTLVAGNHLGANAPFDFTPGRGLYEVPPGWSLYVMPLTVNVAVIATFQWWEV